MRLRAALDAAGFTQAAVDALIGQNGRYHLHGGEVVPVRRRLRDGSPLTTLTRLFVAELSCPIDKARSALGSDLESWVAAGVIAIASDEAAPLIALDWAGDLLIASDARSRASQREYVMGPSAPGAALAGLTIRHPVDTTVDIGCGSGLQALAAAGHSQRVLAYDVNPRAVFFTQFNAGLNGISKVHSERADLFDLPVKEEAGLVVSNPPYVISPGLSHQYRDSGREGDAVCRHLASLIPSLLAPSGIGQFMANWIVTRREPWSDRLASWFEGSDCDVWILREMTEEASSYVANWLRETNAPELRGNGVLYERWMHYFEEQGIVGVGYGLITMRRRDSGTGKVWIEDAPDSYTFPCSSSMAAYLDQRCSIGGASDAELLVQRWRPSPDLAIDETRMLEPDPPKSGALQACLVRGLRWRHGLGAEVIDVLENCDGARRLDEVIADVARSRNRIATELISNLMPVVRQLLEHGLLVPG